MTGSLMIAAALAVGVVEVPNSIRISGPPNKSTLSAALPVDLRGSLPAGRLSQETGEQLLRLQLRREDGTVGPNIFASYRHEKGRLIVEPRFTLVPGQTYLVTLLVGGQVVASRLHRVPVSHRNERPVVKKVFPTANRLPANHLKFYIQFSSPMREGRYVFEQIKLFDANGKEVRNPWRRQELWNADATQLTLWIHPGRVKTGVNLREDEGPVLISNKAYSLRIGAGLKGLDGQPLDPYRKVFSTLPEDIRRPLPVEWNIGTVRVDSRELLRVKFGETLDAALAKRSLHLYGPDGKAVLGRTRLEHDQSVWEFTPRKPWLNGKHRILVAEDLEDLAGNTPKRLFDTDLKASRLEPAILELSFQPTAGR